MNSAFKMFFFIKVEKEMHTTEESKYRVVKSKRKEDLWRFYKNAVDKFWTPEEIKMDLDLQDWNGLKEPERKYLKHILAFFAESDGIVNENLLERFTKDAGYIEAQYFYNFQAAMENIHAETYQLILDYYISDLEEKDHLFNSIRTIPVIKKKADWAHSYIASTESFAERLLAFACIEGIFFSGSFAAIFYMRKRGLLPGLAQANTLISRDEGLHVQFACNYYKNYTSKLPLDRVKEIVSKAVEIEKEFQTEALSVSLIGMNNVSMCKYIEFVADHLLNSIGENKIYNVENPFEFMKLISYDSNDNTFELKSANYSNGVKSIRKKLDLDEEVEW